MYKAKLTAFCQRGQFIGYWNVGNLCPVYPMKLITVIVLDVFNLQPPTVREKLATHGTQKVSHPRYATHTVSLYQINSNVLRVAYFERQTGAVACPVRLPERGHSLLLSINGAAWRARRADRWCSGLALRLLPLRVVFWCWD